MKRIIPKLLFPLLLYWLPCISGDTDPAPVPQIPAEKPGQLFPLIQRDGHSCGFLALSAIYKS